MKTTFDKFWRQAVHHHDPHSPSDLYLFTNISPTTLKALEAVWDELQAGRPIAEGVDVTRLYFMAQECVDLFTRVQNYTFHLLNDKEY